tara:strand:+ start:866 stop:1036 length:171 start_codon:yes stop_codon:yes gene_type:complete
MARYIVVLAGIAVLLFAFQHIQQDKLNRRSIERGVDAASGNLSRPVVPIRRSGSGQ